MHRDRSTRREAAAIREADQGGAYAALASGGKGILPVARRPQAVGGGTMTEVVTMRVRALLLCVAVLGSSNCSRGGPEEPGTPPQLTVRQAVVSAAPTRAVGEDCTRGGASECRSGRCLHYKPEPGGGYVCSRTCASDAECPEEFSCRSWYPGEEGWCTPPASWAARPARDRPVHPAAGPMPKREAPPAASQTAFFDAGTP